jgi:hypothetical protein
MSKMKLLLDLSGRDSVFLSNINHYLHGFVNLDLLKNNPSVSLDQLSAGVNVFAQTYEGGINGDRVEIARRKKARKEVTELFEKIRFYLQSIATEDDIPALLQAGFQVSHTSTRKKQVVAPA